MKIAPNQDGIPVVTSTAMRDTFYPSPATNQRVHNLETGAYERYDGTEWVSDFGPPALVPGNDRTVPSLTAYLANNAPFNPLDYAEPGQTINDGVTDAGAAIRSALAQTAAAGAANGGRAACQPGTYKVTSNPFGALVGTGNVPVQLLLVGAKILSTVQVKLPRSTSVLGTNRLRCGFVTDPTFIASAAIASIARASDIVTVETTTAHGLEANATVVLQSVTDTSFNVGVEIASVPTATTFTFAQTGSDATSSGGTVYIPFLVLGDGQQATGNPGVRCDNLSIDTQNIVDSVGLYSHNIGEQSGGSHLLVTNVHKRGIWLERFGLTTGGPNNYHFYDIETGVTPDVGAVGVYVRSTAALHRGFDHVTTNTATNAGTSAAGFDISGAPGLYSRIHCEHATDGVLIGGRGSSSSVASGKDSAGIVVAGITGHSSITNLVRLRTGGETHDITIKGVAGYGAVNTIVDETISPTITLVGGFGTGMDDYVGEYAIGGIPTSVRYSTSPRVPWLIGDITQGSNTLAATLQHILNAAAGQNRQILFETGGNARWIVRVDSTAEGGGDDGSNWSINARTDAGGSIDQPIFAYRRAGREIQINRPLRLAKSLQVSTTTPAQITADQNNYALAVACTHRLSSDAARNITGLVLGDAVSGLTIDGTRIRLVNIGAFAITLKHLSASSSSANRIFCPGAVDKAIAANGVVWLEYDATSGFWRVDA